MASPNGKKSSTVQSTRQQLDELDALLQKMLTLPVAPSEAAAEDESEPTPAPALVVPVVANPVVADPGPAAPAPEIPALPKRVSLRPVPSAPIVAETPAPAPVPESPLSPRLVPADTPLPGAEPPAAESTEDWVPLRGHWQPSAQTWGPLAEMFRQQQQGIEPTVTTSASPDEPGVIRESVLMPPPDADTAEPAYLSFLPQAPAPSAPVPPPLPVPVPEPEPSVAEVPLNSMEAMARLEMARRAASPPTPPPVPVPPPPPVPLSTQLLAEAPTAPRSGLGSLVLFPFIAVNAVYDVATYPLGPVGRWLRDGGRGALGMLGGMFLVATTAILALDWFDWTW